MHNHLLRLAGIAAMLSACQPADRAEDISGPGNQAGMAPIGGNHADDAENAASPVAPANQGSSNVRR